MSRKPNYSVLEDNGDHLLIQDIGPWDSHLSVTNGAEEVVKELWRRLNGRQLRYIDSEGDTGILEYDRDEFIGFAPLT